MSSRLIAFPLSALPLISSLAFADTTAESDTVVITASRLNELSNLPASVSVITSNDIKNSPSKTLPELLAQEVGVNTTSLFSHGSRASVGLRGFGERATQNTLILLDGRRLNDIDLSSVNFSAIPVENIERIEILRGSGAVLYGDGATGGTINIITRDPRSTKPYTAFSATGGSFDYRDTNLFTSYAGEQFSLTANLNSTKDNGYRDNNSYEQHNGQLDIRVPAAKGEAYAKIGAYKQDMELPGVRRVDPTVPRNELESNRKGTITPNDWADEATEFVTLGYSADINTRDSLIIDAGYRHKQQLSQFDYGGGFGAFSDTLLETLSLTPRLDLQRNIAQMPVSWKLGADLYLYDYHSDRANFEVNRNRPIHRVNVEQTSAALYGQGLLKVTDSTHLNAGWRSQQVRQKATDDYDATAPGAFGTEAPDFTETDFENSFELGIKHLINDNWDVYGRIGRSIRFGTVDELFETVGGQQVFSKLKPQISHGAEWGVSYGNDWLTSSLAVFVQEIENEIRYNPVTFQNINIDDTRHKGAELSLQTQITPTVELKAGYTYLLAEFTEGTNKGNEIPLIPEHTFNVTALASFPEGIKGAVSWNYVGDSLFANDMTNTFGLKIPSYQTVDLKLTKKIERLEFALQVNNLFDEKYYNFAVNSTATAGKYNAYPLPERSAYLTVSYEFN